MASYGSLPFQEAVAYLKAKTDRPTERWDAIAGRAHDHAFIVAEASKVGLLSDLHAEVVAAQAQFTEHFKAAVAKHGWTGWTGDNPQQQTDFNNI
jgi:hypothetical protein